MGNKIGLGHSKLLVSGKFKQFSDLIEVAQTANIQDFRVSVDELHGFWDLITLQIEDINNKFNKLEELRANNWIHPVVIQTEIKKNHRKKSTNTAYSEAARRRLSAVKLRIKTQMSVSDNI